VVEHPDTIEQRKNHWLPKNEAYISDCYKGEYRYPLSPGICTQLFTRMVVTVDGKVLPCCEVWDDSSMFGDLLSESFEGIWYNRKYLEARSRFLKKDFQPRSHVVCLRCNNFGAQPSLKDKFNLLTHVYRKCIGHWAKTFF